MIRLDAQSYGHLVHRYLAYCEFTKMDDTDPENKKTAYTKKGYRIQWKNIKNDLYQPLRNAQRFAERLGVDLKSAYQIGAIAVDVADAGGFQNSGVSTTLTVSHACASNAVLAVGTFEAYAALTSLTYNSVSLGSKLANDGDSTSNIYGTLSPASGTHDIVGTMAGTSPQALCGWSFTGAETGSFGGATNATTGTSASPTVSVTTNIDNSFVVGLIAALPSTGTLTASDSQTVNATGTSEGYKVRGAYIQKVTAGSQAMGWSNGSGSNYFGTTVVEIRQALATASSATSRMLRGIGT